MEGEWQERDYSISEYVPMAAGSSSKDGSSKKPGTPERGLKEEGKTAGTAGEEGEEGTGVEQEEPPYFRITVKRLPGGLVSGYLHDVMQEGCVSLSVSLFAGWGCCWCCLFGGGGGGGGVAG